MIWALAVKIKMELLDWGILGIHVLWIVVFNVYQILFLSLTISWRVYFNAKLIVPICWEQTESLRRVMPDLSKECGVIVILFSLLKESKEMSAQKIQCSLVTLSMTRNSSFLFWLTEFIKISIEFRRSLTSNRLKVITDLMM